MTIHRQGLTGLALLILLGTAQAGATVRTYSNPQLGDTALSACLADGTGCGKAAADAFCKREGYEAALLFARRKVAETIHPDNEQTCSTGDCDAFASVKCFGAAAPAATGSIAPQP